MEEKAVKIAAKMIIAAVFSLTIGVAFASPMLVSDLNNKPEVQNVQGPTADFNVEVVYSNYTNPNNSSIAYQIKLNTINLADDNSNLTADIIAQLVDVNSTFAEKTANILKNALAIEILNETSAAKWWHAPDIGCPWYRILVYEKFENNTGVACYLGLPTNMTAARIFVENLTK
jgi:hypothetical protein